MKCPSKGKVEFHKIQTRNKKIITSQFLLYLDYTYIKWSSNFSEKEKLKPQHYEVIVSSSKRAKSSCDERTWSADITPEKYLGDR